MYFGTVLGERPEFPSLLSFPKASLSWSLPLSFLLSGFPASQGCCFGEYGISAHPNVRSRWGLAFEFPAFSCRRLFLGRCSPFSSPVSLLQSIGPRGGLRPKTKSGVLLSGGNMGRLARPSLFGTPALPGQPAGPFLSSPSSQEGDWGGDAAKSSRGGGFSIRKGTSPSSSSIPGYSAIGKERGLCLPPHRGQEG